MSSSVHLTLTECLHPRGPSHGPSAGDYRRHHRADRGAGERLGHGGWLWGVALPGDADVWHLGRDGWIGIGCL